MPIGFGGISNGAGLIGYGLGVKRNLSTPYAVTAKILYYQELCYISGCAYDIQENRIDVTITEFNFGISYLYTNDNLKIFSSAGLGYLRGTAAVNCDEFALQQLFSQDICDSVSLDDVSFPLDFSFQWGETTPAGINLHFNFNSIKRISLASFIWSF